jgi:NAD(P)-dependent dehydrogenase (short-subunit alcohol dehydrogenase family)
MPHWTASDIPSLTGKLAIVTGANSGIGKSTARELARAGARVILACRSTNKADDARNQIVKKLPHAQFDLEALDLSDLKSVRAFADRILRRNVPIDLLINNAGVMMPPKRKTTADGFELQFGTNHLGHFALTGLLLPALMSAPAARIVTVASIAHKDASIHFDDLQGEKTYNAWKWYGQSKLANLLFGFELERKLRAGGAKPISIVAHPGVSSTQLFNNGPGSGNRILRAIGNVFVHVVGQSEDRGALPSLYAATSPDATGGKYYGPDGIGEYRGYPVETRAKPQANDAAAASKLWGISEDLTGVRFEALENR